MVIAGVQGLRPETGDLCLVAGREQRGSSGLIKVGDDFEGREHVIVNGASDIVFLNGVLWSHRVAAQVEQRGKIVLVGSVGEARCMCTIGGGGREDDG